jgi:hypothetical protein
MEENTQSQQGDASEDASSQRKPSGDLVAELQELGRNLKDILQTAWESQERKKLQSEIESGLSQLGDSLNQAVDEFKESPAGQRVKSDAENLRAKIKTGEVENEIREDLLSVLRTMNAELQKATRKVEDALNADSQDEHKGE